MTGASGAASPKVMRLRFAGICRTCGSELAAGERAAWHSSTKDVECLGCLQPAAIAAQAIPSAQQAPAAHPPTPEPALVTELDRGDPGASLLRTYQHRSKAREFAIRTRHPRIGGFVLAVTSEPASTTAMKKGYEGEQAVAAALERRCGDAVVFLHNRSLGPKRRDGDIDHVAITPSGVFAIDAKNYDGAKVEVRRRGGLFSERSEQLYVRGRERTKLLDGIAKQIDAIRTALIGIPGADVIPVGGVLCFVGAEFPLLWKESIGGVPLRGAKGTSKLLKLPGPLDASQRASLAAHLAVALPRAR